MKHRENIPNTCQTNPGTSFFQKKKAPAGGRTTDKGFLYVIFQKKKPLREAAQQMRDFYT